MTQPNCNRVTGLTMFVPYACHWYILQLSHTSSWTTVTLVWNNLICRFGLRICLERRKRRKCPRLALIIVLWTVSTVYLGDRTFKTLVNETKSVWWIKGFMTRHNNPSSRSNFLLCPGLSYNTDTVKMIHSVPVGCSSVELGLFYHSKALSQDLSFMLVLFASIYLFISLLDWDNALMHCYI